MSKYVIAYIIGFFLIGFGSFQTIYEFSDYEVVPYYDVDKTTKSVIVSNLSLDKVKLDFNNDYYYSIHYTSNEDEITIEYNQNYTAGEIILNKNDVNIDILRIDDNGTAYIESNPLKYVKIFIQGLKEEKIYEINDYHYKHVLVTIPDKYRESVIINH